MERLTILNNRLNRLNAIYYGINRKEKFAQLYHVQFIIEQEFYAIAGKLLSEGKSIAHLM